MVRTGDTHGPAQGSLATPPSHDDGCDVPTGQPVRYRRFSSVLEDTEDEAVREQFERCLLVRCLFSAEEPRDVDEALGSKAWKAPWMMK